MIAEVSSSYRANMPEENNFMQRLEPNHPTAKPGIQST